MKDMEGREVHLGDEVVFSTTTYVPHHRPPLLKGLVAGVCPDSVTLVVILVGAGAVIYDREGREPVGVSAGDVHVTVVLHSEDSYCLKVLSPPRPRDGATT